MLCFTSCRKLLAMGRRGDGAVVALKILNQWILSNRTTTLVKRIFKENTKFDLSSCFLDSPLTPHPLFMQKFYKILSKLFPQLCAIIWPFYPISCSCYQAKITNCRIHKLSTVVGANPSFCKNFML